MRFLYLQPPSTDLQLPLAEACCQWTPHIALGRQGVFLDMQSVERLHSKHEVLRKLEELLGSWSVHGKLLVGEANTALEAFLQVQWGTAQAEALPLRALLDVVRPFQGSLNVEMEKEIFSILHKCESLGLRNLQAFQNIPEGEISSRLGSVGVFLWRQWQARGGLSVWPAWRPAEVIQEEVQLDLEARTESTESLVFLIKQLLDRLESRLRWRGQTFRRIEFVWEQEHLSVVGQPRQSLELQLMVTPVSQRQLLQMLRERWDQALVKTPLQASLEKLELRALEVVPLKGAQKDLFFVKQEQQQEEMNAVLTQLQDRLGRQRVFQAQAVAGYRMEQGWRKVDCHVGMMDSMSWTPLRPLRCLEQSVEGQVCGRMVQFPGWDPVDLAQRQDLEKISSDWWNHEPERVYFRARSVKGHWLWLYREKQKIYLQGVFD